MTELNAGELRTRVSFWRRSSAVGSRGQSTNAYTSLGERNCKLEWLTGSELEQARQVFAKAQVRLTLRKPRSFALAVTDQARISGQNNFGIGSALPASVGFDDLVLLCEVIL